MFDQNSSRPGKIAILAYHSLDDLGCVLSTPPRIFAEQMKILRESGVKVVPLSDIPRRVGTPTAENVAAITFDDGFKNVYEHGLPILQRHGFPATVFPVTDFCGRSNDWPGQPPHIRRRPLLSWSEIQEMSRAGVAFGSHTRTHADLKALPAERVEEEMVSSKKKIEDTVGRAAETFAYPYGAYDETTREIARRHFSLACSARLGMPREGGDLFALERLDMYYLRRPLFFRRLFSPWMDAYLGLRRTAREWAHP